MGVFKRPGGKDRGAEFVKYRNLKEITLENISKIQYNKGVKYGRIEKKEVH